MTRKLGWRWWVWLLVLGGCVDIPDDDRGERRLSLHAGIHEPEDPMALVAALKEAARGEACVDACQDLWYNEILAERAARALWRGGAARGREGVAVDYDARLLAEGVEGLARRSAKDICGAQCDGDCDRYCVTLATFLVPHFIAISGEARDWDGERAKYARARAYAHARLRRLGKRARPAVPALLAWIKARCARDRAASLWRRGSVACTSALPLLPVILRAGEPKDVASAFGAVPAKTRARVAAAALEEGFPAPIVLDALTANLPQDAAALRDCLRLLHDADRLTPALAARAVVAPNRRIYYSRASAMAGRYRFVPTSGDPEAFDSRLVVAALRHGDAPSGLAIVAALHRISMVNRLPLLPLIEKHPEAGVRKAYAEFVARYGKRVKIEGPSEASGAGVLDR